MVTQKRLKELVNYCEETGEFTWLHSSGRAVEGQKAGYLRPPKGNKTPYLVIGIDGNRYFAHRLAWLYMTGEMPAHQIDHINGIGNDNRWENLRHVTNAENCKNMALGRKSASGARGVRRSRNGNRWEATIGVNYKLVWIGSFGTREEAIRARKAAEEAYGFHRNHGRKA